MNWVKTIMWGLMVFLAIVIGLYAFLFFLVPDVGGPEFKSHFSKTRAQFFVRKAVYDDELLVKLMKPSTHVRENVQAGGEPPFPGYL